MMTDDPKAERVDSETLAAYVDRRLTAGERADVEARLAADPDSYELLVEVMRTHEALGDVTAAPARTESTTRTFVWAAGALAAAAALVIAVRFGPGLLPSQRPANSLEAALLAAVGNERYLEPRLTGGFPSGPVRSANRGQGDLSSQNLALLAAAGEAQKRAQAESGASNLQAWGVAQLLLGSYDDAIESLESAAIASPAEAALLSDLAAAYAARAARDRSAQDWSNALERSEQALRSDGNRLEALFNRALALEALHLDGAHAAWQAYLDRDSTSAWADEARDRLAKLSAKPQGSIRPSTDAAIRAALDTGTSPADLERAVRSDPQRAREWLEEDLAREWAVAVRDHDGAGETRARARADRLVAAYSAVSQDALPKIATQAMWSRVTDRPRFAAAVVQFADAANLVREDHLPEAAALVAQALPVLQSSGSPLELWARYFRVLEWSQRGLLAECLTELDRLQTSADRQGFAVLSGTLRNRRGQIFSRQGNLEGAIRERLDAIPIFERAADRDQIAVMHSMVAEANRFLGDAHAAWTHHAESLKWLASAPNYRSRHLVFVQAGLTCTFEGHYGSALAFQHEVVENGRQWQRASATSTGLLHIARNAFRLHRLDEADAAVRDARAIVAQVPEPSARQRFELELLEVEGEIFAPRRPAEALPILTRAIEQFSSTGFAVRLSGLLLSRGRVYSRNGDAAAAERDWQEAVEALERERATVSAESLRLAQAGSLRGLQTEIALSRFRQGRDAADSLEPIERGHARTLVEDALRGSVPASGIRDLQDRLGDRTGVLYYAVSDEQAVGWLLTRRGVIATALPVNPVQLASLIDRHRRAFSAATSRNLLLETSRALYRVLLTPFAAQIDDLTALVVIPDPALAGVSFAALNNPDDGRYLIEAAAVAMAPSGALLAQPISQSRRSRVLLVGADRPEGLAPLPWVADELSQLARVYDGATVLSGADATRERFLNEGSRASVIHFAGHAVASPANPLLSRLMLHAGADGRSDLYAYELSGLDVASAVVVLAACRTGYAGAGIADDDGVLAMARPFLARGARAVMATYRDVSDSGAPELMTAFHRHLKDGQSAPESWQATAIEALRAPNATTDWMAYAVFLGRGSLATAGGSHVTDDTLSGGKS